MIGGCASTVEPEWERRVRCIYVDWVWLPSAGVTKKSARLYMAVSDPRKRAVRTFEDAPAEWLDAVLLSYRHQSHACDKFYLTVTDSTAVR